MKTAYLNNITDEALRYGNRFRRVDQMLDRKVLRLLKLIRYRNCAYNGRIEL